MASLSYFYTMELNEVDAIIFDFGGVLINIDYEATINAFRSLGLDSFDEMYSKASQSNLFDDFEIGKISQQRFINGILNYLPSGITPNQVVHAWNAMILDVPASVISLLNDLKSDGKKIYLLSNTNEIHIPVAYKRWKEVSPLSPDEIFDKVYLSHEINQRKPHVSTFRWVLHDSGLDPERTLFVDDSIQHIEGAKLAGLRVLHIQVQEDLYTLFS